MMNLRISLYGNNKPPKRHGPSCAFVNRFICSKNARISSKSFVGRARKQIQISKQKSQNGRRRISGFETSSDDFKRHSKKRSKRRPNRKRRKRTKNRRI
jgi:hypothetical protein